MKYELESLILETLYEKSEFIIQRQGNKQNGYIPLYKKNYFERKLHFGTLVDILNNPQNYDHTKLDPLKLSGLIKKENEILLKDYGYDQVSDAIDVLALNGHVKDNAPKGVSDIELNRTIEITQKGVIDYRNQFYLNEAERILSIHRSYEIQKKDQWQKKNWIFVEISKYIIGGIVGAAITLFVSRF